MKQTIFFFIPALAFLCCTGDLQTLKTKATGSPVSNALHRETGESSFVITKKDSLNGFEYNTAEVSYQVVYIAPKGEITHYWAKFTTTTKSCTGCEGAEKSTQVELHPFDQPDQTVCTIRHDCDEVKLEADYYKTIKHGCCGAEDQLTLYDYANNLIIEGEGKIVLGSIPNSKIKMWVAYKPAGQDSTTIGVIYLCYTGSERYAIKIKSPPLPLENCNPYSPEIAIRSTDPRDKVTEDANVYDLWSFDGLEQIGKIRHLTLRITFECGEAPQPLPIDIPVVDGKPFGKEDRMQELVLRF